MFGRASIALRSWLVALAATTSEQRGARLGSSATTLHTLEPVGEWTAGFAPMERFRVIRSVGKGSFGLALLVQRKSDGVSVASKTARRLPSCNTPARGRGATDAANPPPPPAQAVALGRRVVAPRAVRGGECAPARRQDEAAGRARAPPLTVPGIASQQQFVIKQINTTRMSRKERAEVENEVAVLSRLRSPNIVAYVESFHHRGALCIVMEYADGGDLEKTLQKRRGRLLPEDMVLDWFIQICLALKYVHNRKILHRDLKPANIMLSTSGSGPPVVKLGDFGIAKVLSNTMELARTAIGTPYYLSPEICREERYNNKSDIWSLGCILYEMCSLKHAFEGRNMKQLVQSIMKGRVAPLPRGFSSGVSELVGACLHRDPRRRPRVDRILQHPLLQKRIDAHIGDDAARAELAHTVIHGLRPMRDLPVVKPD
ncbi:NEK1, partial [Symbiodinium sp. KB8]